MKNYIYCTASSKGKQSFYLIKDRTKYFLFTQDFRISNKDIFAQGVFLFDVSKLKKHRSFSVRHTALKIPKYIKYIEKEFGIAVLDKKPAKEYINQSDWNRFEENLLYL